MQKIGGNVFYHTAMSTAFPQTKPGTAPSPGPMKVPAEGLGDVLGITHVNYVAGSHSLAVVDSSLAMNSSHASSQHTANSTEVEIDNFAFTPKSLRVQAGATVTWTNHDDIPHAATSTEKKFASPVLDTGQSFSFRLQETGSY